MSEAKKQRWDSLAIHILFPVFVGSLAGLLTQNSNEVYAALKQPPFAPPGFIFPIVWLALFILMGFSSYIIRNSDSPNVKSAMIIYAIQLAMNFAWSFLFFRFHVYFLSFVWLILLWVAIFMMIQSFLRIDKRAAYLQIPYLLWTTFAGYLTLAISLLNR